MKSMLLMHYAMTLSEDRRQETRIACITNGEILESEWGVLDDALRATLCHRHHLNE
jgi:hypothetical protein